MDKVRLGRTGLMVNKIGFGGIPIQRLTDKEAITVISRCLDLGVDFLDTANAYSTSEERIGKAIKGRRHNVYIATKTGARTREGILENLDLSLKRLGTDYIDLYQFHGVNDIPTLEKILSPEEGLYQAFEEARKAGKIRHIGITSHQMDAAKAEIKSGQFDTVMFPFNFITCEPADELLPLCKEYDVGFIDMKPMAGGMLENATVAFKYLFQFPEIVLIPGVQDIREIEEIMALYEGSHGMTAAERAEMHRLTDELGTRFCRRCEYCQPCQQGIAISLLMTFPALIKRLPPDWYLKKHPFIPSAMEKAANCVECGECEARCPYNLPIREMIKESYSLYEKVKAEHGA